MLLLPSGELPDGPGWVRELKLDRTGVASRFVALAAHLFISFAPARRVELKLRFSPPLPRGAPGAGSGARSGFGGDYPQAVSLANTFTRTNRTGALTPRKVAKSSSTALPRTAFVTESSSIAPETITSPPLH
jgi:hypothetical protein